MSAIIKFIPVDELEIGELPDELMPRWKKILAMKKQLEGLENAYNSTLKAFFADTKKVLDLEPDHSRKEPQLVIDEDGQVYQAFCACPICQSEAQEIPLGSILEALQAEGAIEPEAATEVRRRAAEEQSKLDAEEKLRLLLN